MGTQKTTSFSLTLTRQEITEKHMTLKIYLSFLRYLLGHCKCYLQLILWWSNIAHAIDCKTGLSGQLLLVTCPKPVGC